MKRIAWIVFGWSAFMATAQAASFDCEKASTKIEKMICGNVDLSRLDEDLSKAYKTALQDEKKSEPTRQAQKKWIKDRNSCQNTACVILAYHNRISELTSNFGSTNSTHVSGLENVHEIATSTKAANVPAVQAPRSEYVYVVHSSSGNVSAYLINATTGALSPVPGSPFAAGSSPSSFTVNPTGTFAYVPNFQSKNVSVFRINATNGALISVPGSPFATGEEENPFFVTINPAGTFAYVVEGYPSAKGNGGGDVLAYRINATTGALTLVPGSPFAAEEAEGPSFVEFNPAGTFAYVDHASTYRINADTGALTPVPDKPPFFLSLNVPNSVMSNSAGTFDYQAYDADQRAGYLSKKITAYRVNTTTGSLTPIPGSSLATDGFSTSVTVNPAGTFLYVTNAVSAQNGNVTAFRINATTGALTPVPGGPFAEGKKPLSITINPLGTFAFVKTLEDDWKGLCSIFIYRINANTGALTPSTINSSSAVTIQFEDPPITIIQP